MEYGFAVGVFVVESNFDGKATNTATRLDVVELPVLTVDGAAIVVRALKDLIVEDAIGPLMLMIMVSWMEVNVPVSG